MVFKDEFNIYFSRDEIKRFKYIKLNLCVFAAYKKVFKTKIIIIIII